MKKLFASILLSLLSCAPIYSNDQESINKFEFTQNSNTNTTNTQKISTTSNLRWNISYVDELSRTYTSDVLDVSVFISQLPSTVLMNKQSIKTITSKLSNANECSDLLDMQDLGYMMMCSNDIKVFVVPGVSTNSLVLTDCHSDVACSEVGNLIASVSY